MTRRLSNRVLAVETRSGLCSSNCTSQHKNKGQILDQNYNIGFVKDDLRNFYDVTSRHFKDAPPNARLVKASRRVVLASVSRQLELKVFEVGRSHRKDGSLQIPGSVHSLFHEVPQNLLYCPKAAVFNVWLGGWPRPSTAFFALQVRRAAERELKAC